MILAGVAALVVVASLLLHQLWPPYFPNIFHPLSGNGYQFWSGIAGATAIFSGVLLFWHKHNCHEHRCLRLAWHPDDDGHPVCKKHHADHPSRGLWWAIKHFFTTGHLGDHDHPRHAKNPARAPGG